MNSWRRCRSLKPRNWSSPVRTHIAYELTHCPICDGAETREIASREEMQREVEALWAFHQRRLRASVPSERLTDRVAFSQYAPVRLVQCTRCSHVYRNPQERETALADAYVNTPSDASLFAALFETQRAAYRAQATRLTQFVGRAGRGLEVGSYVGGFLAAARERGWQFHGVDVSQAAAAYAMRRGFAVTTGTLADVVTSTPFDVVAIWNTFEQLPDVRVACHAARRILRDGGTLVVRVPNGAFYVPWHRRFHRGGVIARRMAEQVLAHNNLLTFPYRQGFTHASLSRLLRESGFEIVHVYGDTLVPVADEWTTRYGAVEERVVKRLLRVVRRGWSAPWVEVFARVT